MTLKTMATAAVVMMAAGAHCGCSALPPSILGSTVGAAPAPVPYAATASAAAATSPTVEVLGERVVGTDPDANVRLDLARNAGFHLHGGN